MTLERPTYESDNSFDANSSLELAEPDHHARDQAPSLPIILISAACGIGGGVIGFYLAYAVFGVGVEISAGIGALMLSFALGATGAILSALTGSRAASANIGFSCGLIVLVSLFFALCSLSGAFVATLVLTLRG